MTRHLSSQMNQLEIWILAPVWRFWNFSKTPFSRKNNYSGNHEYDLSHYALRIITFRDGKVISDAPNLDVYCFRGLEKNASARHRGGGLINGYYKHNENCLQISCS